MGKKNTKTIYIARAAVIAALYAALTYAAGLAGLSYGAVQFRFSEALTVLAVLTPSAVPGLTVGCLLGNLASPYGLLDILLGTAATFAAAVLTRATRKVAVCGLPVLAPVFSAVINAVAIGLEIAFFLPEGITWAGFATAALQVGAGELAVCCLLGLPLCAILTKRKIFRGDNT